MKTITRGVLIFTAGTVVGGAVSALYFKKKINNLEELLVERREEPTEEHSSNILLDEEEPTEEHSPVKYLGPDESEEDIDELIRVVDEVTYNTRVNEGWMDMEILYYNPETNILRDKYGDVIEEEIWHDVVGNTIDEFVGDRIYLINEVLEILYEVLRYEDEEEWGDD